MPGYIPDAIDISSPQQMLNFFTCWGGVPRYWEVAQPYRGQYREALDELVLSPLGVLHDEVDRLLRQEMPSAIPLRPILDAIGMGARKSSEIASRLQTPATSISRSLQQLQQLGYIRREVPFGENEKRSKRALYLLADPFLNLWFSVVAPHRSSLQTAGTSARLTLLDKSWPHLRASAWETLCRLALPRLRFFNREWQSAGRYWKGNQCEWDAVSQSLDNEIIILGECKCLDRPATDADLNKIIRAIMAKPAPPFSTVAHRRKYVIFVPELRAKPRHLPENITIQDGKSIFSALRCADEF